MIEINLLPGGRKKSSKKGRLALSLPNFGALKGFALPAADPWIISAAASVAVALLGSGWFLLSTSGDAEAVQAQIEVAVQDSARYAATIARSATLQAQSDTIARRVAIIQEIDQARYVWPHLVDEVGRAVPDYVWLTRFAQVAPGDPIAFQIEGRAGTMLALTTFMEALEASPYIQGVEFVSTQQVEQGAPGGLSQMIYQFTFDMQSETPPPELVQRVPLFGPADSAGGGT